MLSISAVPLAAWLLGIFHEIAIVTFGYIIPALSSVKAVLHRDVDAYHQWVTYFVILYIYQTILEPIHNLILPSFIKLPLILWLSLQRYQGALWVYSHLVQPFILEKYEKDVDDGIQHMKTRLNQKILECIGAVGWGALSQIGVLVSAVRGDSNQEQYSFTSSSSIISPNASTSISSFSNHENKVKRKSNPQHSISFHSASSFSSYSSLTSIIEDDTADYNFEIPDPLRDEYIKDFLDMLASGLFVFAGSSSEKQKIFSNTSQKEKEDSETILTNHTKKKKRRICVFSYEEDLEAFSISENNNNYDSLNDNDFTTIPLSSLLAVNASGTHGIEILVTKEEISEKTCEKDTDMQTAINLSYEIILSDTEDRDILLHGLIICMLNSRAKNNNDVEFDVNDDNTYHINNKIKPRNTSHDSKTLGGQNCVVETCSPIKNTNDKLNDNKEPTDIMMNVNITPKNPIPQEEGVNNSIDEIAFSNQEYHSIQNITSQSSAIISNDSNDQIINTIDDRNNDEYANDVIQENVKENTISKPLLLEEKGNPSTSSASSKDKSKILQNASSKEVSSPKHDTNEKINDCIQRVEDEVMSEILLKPGNDHQTEQMLS